MTKKSQQRSTAAERRAEKELDELLRRFNSPATPTILAELKELS